MSHWPDADRRAAVPAPPPPSGRDWWPFVEAAPDAALPARIWAPALIAAVAVVLALVAIL